MEDVLWECQINGGGVVRGPSGREKWGCRLLANMCRHRLSSFLSGAQGGCSDTGDSLRYAEGKPSCIILW